MKGIHAQIMCLLFSLPALGGSLEIAQWIPWPLVREQFDRGTSQLDLSGKETKLSLDWQSLNPKADSLEWKLAGAIETFQINSSGILASANSLTGDIVVSNLNIDQIVLLEAGGNEIRVRIKANCTPIRLSLSSFSVDVSALLENSGANLNPRLTNFDLNLLPGSYAINSFSCTGIGGLNSEITARVRSLLQNPENISALIFPLIARELPKLWGQQLASLNQSLGSEIQIIAMEQNEEGLYLFAQLPLKSNSTISLPELGERVFSASKPQLILSQAGFNALLSEKILSLIPNGYDLQKVEAFAGLMKSRVKQYLAWPDLRRFPSTSPFPISIGPDFFLQTSNDKATLKTNGVLKASLGGSEIDYLNFGVVIDTTISATVKDSVLTLKTGKAVFDLVYSYGAIYQILFNPDPRISTSIFKTALSSFFSQKVVSGDLPTLDFLGQKWKLQNWKQDQDLITMDWEE